MEDQPYNSRPMTNDILPNIDDEDIEGKMSQTLDKDRELSARICALLPFLNWPEKMAAGLYAYWFIDQTHSQLCEIKPKHGEFSAALANVIDLVQQFSPQAKAEFASEILTEDWEMGLVDSPATIIE